MLADLLGNILNTIDTAVTAIRERLRPDCRRVVFRAAVLSSPITARCGDPIDLACASGYCREHCRLFCHCDACGCTPTGEVIYDAAAGDNRPS